MPIRCEIRSRMTIKSILRRVPLSNLSSMATTAVNPVTKAACVLLLYAVTFSEAASRPTSTAYLDRVAIPIGTTFNAERVKMLANVGTTQFTQADLDQLPSSVISAVSPVLGLPSSQIVNIEFSNLGASSSISFIVIPQSLSLSSNTSTAVQVLRVAYSAHNATLFAALQAGSITRFINGSWPLRTTTVPVVRCSASRYIDTTVAGTCSVFTPSATTNNFAARNPPVQTVSVLLPSTVVVVFAVAVVAIAALVVVARSIQSRLYLRRSANRPLAAVQYATDQLASSTTAVPVHKDTTRA